MVGQRGWDSKQRDGLGQMDGLSLYPSPSPFLKKLVRVLLRGSDQLFCW